MHLVKSCFLVINKTPPLPLVIGGTVAHGMQSIFGFPPCLLMYNVRDFVSVHRLQ